MADVFVIFGSSSDEAVYSPLLEKLKQTGISCEFKVLSAHKTPKELDEEIAYAHESMFIAGAGLAAALPGVVAAQTVKPVIGLPCDGAFNGLDSFLSIAQMPPDVPVIAVGVAKIDEAVRLCSSYLHGLNKIVLVEKKSGDEKKYFAKCKAFMEENNIPFQLAKSANRVDYGAVFIEFIKLGKKIPHNNNIVLHVPVKDGSKKSDALKMFDQMQSAYAISLNGYKNAAIAALELVNLRKTHDTVLGGLRRKASQKVMDSNK
ncbi:MAG: AIR carboxylase family protein [archaeon]